MQWFRFYESALDDPKVQRLPAELFRAWVNLLCLASRNEGELPAPDVCAFALRVTEEAFHETVSALHDAGLLDKKDDIYSPHNWKKRQFMSDNSTARVRKYRQKARKTAVSESVSGNDTPKETKQSMKRFNIVSVTPPDTDTESYTDNNITPLTPRGGDFAIWYAAYPHKVGRAAAEKAFKMAIRKTDLQTLLDGVEAYRRAKPADRAWCNPSTWLNQERWNDRPAPQAMHSGSIRNRLVAMEAMR
jgi:hypothetical protein